MIKPTCEDTFLIKNRDLKNGYHSLIFNSYSRTTQCRPGQFLHVQVPCSEIFFRRAFSIASVSAEQRQVEIILKIFGRGSKALSTLRKNDRINLLGRDLMNSSFSLLYGFII